MTDEPSEELAEYYMLTREQFAEMDPEGPSARDVLDRMVEGDRVLLAAVATEGDATIYLPIVLMREGGAEALINLNWMDESQKEAIRHCLERLETFTRSAYDNLPQEIPEQFLTQRDRLTGTLDEALWPPERFVELDESLYQLRQIVTDLEADSEFAQNMTGFDELFAAIDVAESNFDAIRQVLHQEEE